MGKNNLDLIPIFQAVTQALTANQQALNQADGYNQNHGTNMVQTFHTITDALEQKQGKTAGTGLSYAARQLAKNATSTSGQLYAQNLSLAAAQLKGKKVDAQTALSLLQMLIGSGTGSLQTGQPTTSLQGARAGVGDTPSPQGGDILGTLLGGLTGSGGSTPSQPASAGGDLLGTLLGGLTGSQPPKQSQQSGLGLDDLLNAGMAYYQAKQGGGSNMEALIQAFTAGSGMGNTTHREQSTQVVVNSFLQALSKQ